MHCDSQSFGETQVEPVKGRIGQHDISDGAVSFKSDRRHCNYSSAVPTSGWTLIGGLRYDRQEQV
jgi:hypothetical protein